MNNDIIGRNPKNLLITGGAGFIGVNFIKFLFRKPDFQGKIINVDALTYAGNLMSLADTESIHKDRYTFIHEDICNQERMEKILLDYHIDTVVHFAAESHVDRSIHGPKDFINTNILGTFSLLEAARKVWNNRDDVLFHHISTDEVFGSLGSSGAFLEATPYDPRSPYSASKASSDHLVRSYFHTYNLPVALSNCSNNYGPYQFPEKIIPLMINNMLQGKQLPVYGDGKNIRDWLFVEDHASAIWTIITSGRLGESYNIGGDNEWENIRLVNELCEIVAQEAGMDVKKLKEKITFVKDRPGHDWRYAIDCTKIKTELNWEQSVSFREGLETTVRWYLENPDWVKHIFSGEYRNWIEKNYDRRDK